MTRILDFSGPRATTRFDLLSHALLNAGDGKGERTTVVIRKEARLLDLFDTLRVNGAESTLRPEGGTLSVSQEDFELLEKYALSAPWLPRAARDAIDLWDFLSAAERRD